MSKIIYTSNGNQVNQYPPLPQTQENRARPKIIPQRENSNQQLQQPRNSQELPIVPQETPRMQVYL